LISVKSMKTLTEHKLSHFDMIEDAMFVFVSSVHGLPGCPDFGDVDYDAI